MNTEERLSHNRPAVDLALLVIRIVLGVIFIAHGSQKLFGAFGGPGLAAWVGMIGKIGHLVAIGEFFGGIGILIGLLSRLSAAAIIIIMLGAISIVHWPHGFFMPNGMEYALANIGLAAAILIAGPGRYSVGKCLPLPPALKRALT